MNGCLLDTHAFLWMAEGDERLSRNARERIERESLDLFLSMASVWEMAIKISLGKLRIHSSLRSLLQAARDRAGIQCLDLRLEHLLPLETLPFHHRDPFDRRLVAQCLTENLEVVSADAAFDAYGVRRVW